jgi:transposase
MLFDVGNIFLSMINELERRVKIEKQGDLFAVIIDGETVTWSVSDQRAREVAIKLIDAGF